MGENIFNESVQKAGPYSKKEIQAVQDKLSKLSLEEVRTQLDGLSTDIENKLKSANAGSLDVKYQKSLTIQENLTLVANLYDKLSTTQRAKIDTYTRGSGEWSIAVAQSALVQLGILGSDTLLGVFDKNTLYAVIAFQKTNTDYKGKPDGLIGKQTLAALQSAVQQTPVQNAPVATNTMTVVELQAAQEELKAIDTKLLELEQNKDPSHTTTQVQNDLKAVESAVKNIADITNIPTIPVTKIDNPTQNAIVVPEELPGVPTVEANTSIVRIETSSEGESDITPTPILQENNTISQNNGKIDITPTPTVNATEVAPVASETTNDWNPVYNTLDDYIISYMDSKGYDLGETPEDLQKQIQKYTKEALIANPGILRYGMVLRAKDYKSGQTFIGTLVEDPREKDFTKSSVLRVNTLGVDGKIKNIAFPLENIVEVLPAERKVLDITQQKKFDQLENKYKKDQNKLKEKAAKAAKKQNKETEQ